VRRVRILLRTARSDSDAWRDAFVAALPEARITVWPDVDPHPDYVVAWKPGAELFERIERPRAIFNLGAGVDAMLAVATLPRDVPLYRLEDAGMGEQMGEYVALAVLAAYREQRAYALAQRERRWTPRVRLDKHSFAVGLLGFGVLGRAVAAALAPFRFPLLAWVRERRTLAGVETFVGLDELSAMLARTRVLVVMLPSTRDTTGIVAAGTLARLPAGAHVVNVARGDLVVDADLIDALDRGHVASATLDVFHDEPLPPQHPFWHHPAVTITPHVSAATLCGRSAAQVAAKIRALERGESVGGRVDVARGY
jgi:glyoxylate/hydroxypyruvate reductase A